MSKRKEASVAATRRDILKLVAVGAPVAAAVAVTGQSAEASEAPSSLGLRKTEHVKKYLDSARF